MPFSDGRIEAVQTALPEAVVRAFVPLTDLGDPLFVMLVVASLYLFVDYARGSFLMGATFTGYGITVALKELLAVPRPPAELQVVSASGFGIPSGHALGAVVVFGVLAAELDVGTRRQRALVAGVLVLLVSASRVVLGVHYVADVVAGLVLGAALLVVLYRFDVRNRPLLFGVGAAGALVAMVLSDLTYASSVVLFGLSLGALVAWPAITPLPEPSRNVAIGVGAVALPLSVLVLPMGPTVYVSTLTAIPQAALAIVLVLAVPNVAARLELAAGVPAGGEEV